MHELDTICVCVKGLDRFPFTIVRAAAQSGGIHLPVRHRHVRTPVLSGELEGSWGKKTLKCYIFHRRGRESIQKCSILFTEANSVGNLHF